MSAVDQGLDAAVQRVRDLIRDPARATEVEAVVRAAREDVPTVRADAWDEGAQAATADYGIGEAANPYRAGLGQKS